MPCRLLSCGVAGEGGSGSSRQAGGTCARRTRGPSVARGRDRVVGEGREEEGKRRGVGRSAGFIPRQSSGGPVHAPCLMQGPPFPDAGLPSDILLRVLV